MLKLFDLFNPQFRKSDMSRTGYLEVFQRVSGTSRYRESTVRKHKATASSHKGTQRTPSIKLPGKGAQSILLVSIFYPEEFWRSCVVFSDNSGIYFFLFLDKNICCGYSLETPRWCAFNEYNQHMLCKENWRKFSNNYHQILLNNFSAVNLMFKCKKYKMLVRLT